MPNTMKNTASTRDRFDQGKWWLVEEAEKIFVERLSGRAKLGGKELSNVIAIQASASKPDIVKVTFGGNERKPLLFRLSVFDFTANVPSQSLEPFVKENPSFCEPANEILKRDKQEKLTEHEVESFSEISNEIPPLQASVVGPVPSTRTEAVGDKRRVSKEHLPVDPLSSTIKRQKVSSANKE